MKTFSLNVSLGMTKSTCTYFDKECFGIFVKSLNDCKVLLSRCFADYILFARCFDDAGAVDGGHTADLAEKDPLQLLCVLVNLRVLLVIVTRVVKHQLQVRDQSLLRRVLRGYRGTL